MSGLIGQFIKDYRFPVKIENPEYFQYYFDYVTENYDPEFRESMSDLRTMREVLGSDEEFKKHCRIASESAIEYVKAIPGWNEFNQSNMVGKPNTYGIASSGMYEKKFAGFNYVSIDLKKANFHILGKNGGRHSANIIPDLSYEDLIGKFTDFAYVSKSKQIRQIIFGNLNPKRQRAMQSNVVLGLVDKLVESGIGLGFFGYSPDELVICGSPDLSLIEDYLEGLPFRVEEFRLEYLGNDCYVKEFSDGKFKLRNVPSTIFMQALKKRLGEDTNEKDLVFEYEKRLARFMEPLTWNE